MTRDRDTILNKFPWTSFLRWLLCGIVVGPIIVLLIYLLLQYVWLLQNGIAPVQAWDSMIADGYSGRRARTSLFTHFTDLPRSSFVPMLALTSLPGGIGGVAIYLLTRKKEIDIVKDL